MAPAKQRHDSFDKRLSNAVLASITPSSLMSLVTCDSSARAGCERHRTRRPVLVLAAAPERGPGT
jgi:hypothetical protein